MQEARARQNNAAVSREGSACDTERTRRETLVIRAISGFDVAVKQGKLAVIGDGEQRFAGREPLSLEAVLRAALKG